jgi:hypothetical protein
MNLKGRFEPLEQFWNSGSMKATTETFVSKLATNMPKSASKFKSAETNRAINGESKESMPKSGVLQSEVLVTASESQPEVIGVEMNSTDIGKPDTRADLLSFVKGMVKAAPETKILEIIANKVGTKAAVALAKPKSQSSSTTFQGSINSLIEISSEVVVSATTKVLEAHTVVDTPKLRSDHHAVPTVTEMVKAHATTTADIPNSIPSTKKPKRSTPFITSTLTSVA